MEGLEWIAASPIAAALKASGTLYLFVNAAHILSIGLIVGAIMPLDLRLLGLFRRYPLSALGPYLSASAAIGVALAILTGICLFSVRPMEYASNPAFLVKLALLACGVVNALSVHGTTRWMVAVNHGKVSPLLRLQALLSLTLWAATLVAGRWIAFV
ncbi:DUF2214 domain-containing protein [Rhizobium sp. ARZ01]|uniref:DUF6644 family protein n=1 Tax=Rhizobium sp. ARZ01 TaxID=2769313 RepID=UPI00177E5957|nr:DUF6644 family protein [Rhizobium sp. ARZ01]MBD9371388.1 DUF2214 domain-containing protein [Rhizobium sp. ARZ01]